MLSLVYFIGVLSVLVLAHEFGHFITAKRLKVHVQIFSLGFGPKLWSIKKDETEYRISGIPLGGYVKMVGDEPTERLEGKPYEFLSRSVGDRFKIIFAGPALNYILAFFIFSVIFMFGSPTLTTEVGGFLKDYPAEKAGVLVGDKILTVDGESVKYWEDMTALIHKHSTGSMIPSVWAPINLLRLR
ncbi:MAG: RIP metalloprotease RseP [Candidatus Omnitrophica bacterium]|nr:RIP metalloprotease RseP [Candidatus Omnitrophota bacterium]